MTGLPWTSSAPVPDVQTLTVDELLDLIESPANCYLKMLAAMEFAKRAIEERKR